MKKFELKNKINEFFGLLLSGLYWLSGISIVGAIITWFFSIYIWLRYGSWPSISINEWIAFVNFKTPGLYTGWVTIDNFYRYIFFQLDGSAFLLLFGIIIFFVTEQLAEFKEE